MTNKYIPIVFLFVTVLLIPGGAFASNDTLNSNDPEQYYDDNDTYRDGNKLEPDFEDLPNPMEENIRTNLTTLDDAHSDVTNIMMQQNDSEIDIEDYDGVHLPITMTYIDEDILIVGLAPIMAHPNLIVDPEIIQDILGIDLPIEIIYMDLGLESHATANTIKSWQDKYRQSCMPVLPAFVNACPVYDRIMKLFHVPIPSGGTDITNTQYALNNLSAVQSGDDIEVTWDAPNFKVRAYKIYISDNNGITYGTRDSVSKTATSYILSDADDGKTYKFKVKVYYKEGSKYKSKSFYTNSVTIPRAAPVIEYTINNLQAAKSGDNIVLTWDKPTDFTPKKYKLRIYEDRSRIVNTTLDKSDTSYTLSNLEEGKTYKFKMYLYYQDDNRQKIKTFYANSIIVPLPVDVTAPVITVPSDIIVESLTSSGKIVTYSVGGSDNLDSRVSTNCTPASGSTFTVGTTIVTCTASDAAGNGATERFTVTVTYEEPELPVIQPPVKPKPITPVNTTQTPNQCPAPTNGTRSEFGIACLFGVGNSGILRGGEPIQISGRDMGSSGFGHGTAGMVIEHNDDPVMLTASHNVNSWRTVTDIWFGGQGFEFGKTIGEVIADTDVATNDIVHADAALVSITHPDIVIHTDEILYGDDVLSVTNYGDLRDYPLDTTTVHMAGRINDSSGTLNIYNVTGAIPVGNYKSTIITHLGVSDYASDIGDSGAPIFVKNTDSTVTFLGIHTGAGCAIKLDDFTMETVPTFEGNPLIVENPDDGKPVVNYGHHCSEQPFKLFTSWSKIKSELGLQ